jgi:hypothetical protein
LFFLSQSVWEWSNKENSRENSTIAKYFVFITSPLYNWRIKSNLSLVKRVKDM